MMRILIGTDAFPPTSGGSGWSTYELARGLRARGHHVRIVQTYSERSPAPQGYDGFDVVGFPAFAPRVPFVRNYFRNERLYDRLAGFFQDLIRRERIELVHAQHVLTGPPAVRAAHAADIPSVCTVRDYWPLCYWNDILLDPHAGCICPGCSAANMTRCLPPRAGMAWPVTLPMIPYMRANLRGKQRALSGADAIVAVSRRVAADLRERSPAVAATRIETIPNGVDVAGVRAQVRESTRPLTEPYAVFVGKLARNKGVSSLVEVANRAALDLPLMVVGDGPERASVLESAGRARCDVRVTGWLDRGEVFRWLQHASFLIFPSNCPETLSRVLIEASALRVPIAAMDTGGTSDIIVDEETGLLSSSVPELATDVARLARDERLRQRLGTAAGQRAESYFDIPVVLTRIEQLYRDVIERHRRH
jgi:glycosyltransferase involved in cell wall biosynthesis